MLQGCLFLTTPKKVSLPQVSEESLLPCGELQQYKTGSKAEILLITVDTADKFYTCKYRHETLIKEYRNLENAVKEFNK